MVMRPSNKIAVALIVASSVIAVSLLFLVPNKGEVVQNDQLTSTFTDTLVSQDSDSDGLADWEEVVWGTDAQNPDTDGDGTLDGEEVLLGRDPRKPAPNDRIDLEAENRKQQQIQADANISETDKLAQDVFTEYLALKNSGTAVTDEEIVSQIATHIKNSSAPTGEPYTQNDVQSISTNTQTLRVYAETMGTLLSVNSPKTGGSEIELLQRALNGGGQREIDGIIEISRLYGAIADGAREVSVPSDLVDTHIALVTNLTAMEQVIFDLSFALKDPLRAVNATSVYVKVLDNVTASLNKISFYYSEKGISFEQGTSGYLFIHAI
ncbi:MAG: hypothetical protein WDZ88_01975 [Candidatus Paceibacterota bacterium]